MSGTNGEPEPREDSGMEVDAASEVSDVDEEVIDMEELDAMEADGQV